MPDDDPRHATIAELIEQELTIAEIAARLGKSRQAVWEYCARRGWLGDESLTLIEAKDERRRQNRLARIAKAKKPRKRKVGPAGSLG